VLFAAQASCRPLLVGALHLVRIALGSHLYAGLVMALWCVTRACYIAAAKAKLLGHPVRHAKVWQTM